MIMEETTTVAPWSIVVWQEVPHEPRDVPVWRD